MPHKVMDDISDIKNTGLNIRNPHPNPLDRPMHSRKGVTVGQHQDEFAEYSDHMGRSFNHLVYTILHGPDKTAVASQPQPQTRAASPRKKRKLESLTTTAAPSPKDKTDMDEYMNNLTYSPVEDARKLIVKNVEPRSKTKQDDDAKRKLTMQAIEQRNAPTDTDNGERKRPGTSSYF